MVSSKSSEERLLRIRKWSTMPNVFVGKIRWRQKICHERKMKAIDDLLKTSFKEIAESWLQLSLSENRREGICIIVPEINKKHFKANGKMGRS